jgi:hypothetical protein
MSFAIHKQVHPPTGVDHAVAAYFTHPIGDGGPPNLVVTQANHLTIFAIRREGTSGGGAWGDDNASLAATALAAVKSPGGDDKNIGAKNASGNNRSQEVSLEVVAEFDLVGLHALPGVTRLVTRYRLSSIACLLPNALLGLALPGARLVFDFKMTC